jgi:hypothetical protein
MVSMVQQLPQPSMVQQLPQPLELRSKAASETIAPFGFLFLIT